MSRLQGAFDDFGMDTITMAGSLEAKVAAVREAGFSQIMLSARDIVGHAGGVAAAAGAVRDSGLRVTGFQVLRDFEGLSGHLHEYKVDIAKSMLEMCQAVGSRVLLACSSTSAHATEDIDSFHIFAMKTPMDALEDIPADKIFLVQLSDFMWQDIRSVEERIATARQFRVFPGEGVHSYQVADLVKRLDRLGYDGDYSFEVFNDDYQQIPLPKVTERARRSALWLSEDELRRSVPLPGQMRLRGRLPVSALACLQHKGFDRHQVADLSQRHHQ